MNADFVSNVNESKNISTVILKPDKLDIITMSQKTKVLDGFRALGWN